MLKVFLRDVLADGPKESKEVERLAKDEDITHKTLRTAREQICTTFKITENKITKSMWKIIDGQVPDSDGQVRQVRQVVSTNSPLHPLYRQVVAREDGQVDDVNGQVDEDAQDAQLAYGVNGKGNLDDLPFL